MAGALLYSTNPWYATDFCQKYCGNKFVVWCGEVFDPDAEPGHAAARRVAPSSSPRKIYDDLKAAYKGEDAHDTKIAGYKRTFRRLAIDFHATGKISENERDEIIAVMKGNSFRIWRPVLFLIPKRPIVDAGRLIEVAHPRRAAYGPEKQIIGLDRSEFDIITWEES